MSGAFGQEAEHAAPERGLAAPGLADEADRLARQQIEADAVDRAHGAALVAVPDVQVAKRQDRLFHLPASSSTSGADAGPTADDPIARR